MCAYPQFGLAAMNHHETNLKPVGVDQDWPDLSLTDLCADTLPAALRAAVYVAGDDDAVVCGPRRVSFAQLAAEVDQVAAAMWAAGIRKGDHVGLCLGNSVEWIVIFYAAASLGAVTVPVNTRLKAEEIAYIVGQSAVSTLFISDRFLKIDFIKMLRTICPSIDSALPDHALPSLRRVVVLGDEVPAGAKSLAAFIGRGREVQPPPADVKASDPLLIQYTSGTTSFPKGVVLSHRNMLWDAYYAGRRFGLRQGERYLSPRPFFHVSGSTLSVLASLQHAACLISTERFEPGALLQLAEEERCTLISGNDTIFLMLLNHPDVGERKLFFRGGWAAASPAVMRRIHDSLGMKEVVVAYGLSEASPNVAMSAWWEPLEERLACRLRPLPGVEVQIRDLETGAALAPGAEGEIFVRGWNVMSEYYDKPEETAAALSPDGWLGTGDKGVLTDDGRLVFIGRAKDIIRVGGENVANAEIEDVLHAHPQILQAQVVAAPDERLVEVPAAFVIPVEGATVSAEEIIAWMQLKLAGFKVPRHIWLIQSFEEIGMTASSKVQKKQLAEHARRLLNL